MECKDCKYQRFNHYIGGSPCVCYECGHPKALEIWAEFDGKKCPAEVENEQSNAADAKISWFCIECKTDGNTGNTCNNCYMPHH